MLRANAEVNTGLKEINRETATPLCISSQRVYADAVKVLLEYSACVNKGLVKVVDQDKKYTKPYSVAANDTVRTLIKNHVGKLVKKQSDIYCMICYDGFEGDTHFLECCSNLIHLVCKKRLEDAKSTQCPICRDSLKLSDIYVFSTNSDS